MQICTFSGPPVILYNLSQFTTLKYCVLNIFPNLWCVKGKKCR